MPLHSGCSQFRPVLFQVFLPRSRDVIHVHTTPFTSFFENVIVKPEILTIGKPLLRVKSS